MADVKIQLGNSGYLQPDKDLPFSLTFSVAEVQDISKKNSAYSKTVVLPGNKNNNKLLGELFEINLTDSTFNINRKNTCIILADDLPLLKGYIQLLSIKKVSPTSPMGDENIKYEVLIFESKANFYDVLGNELLTDLDLSRFNHTYYYTNILGSSGNTYQNGYVYPLFNNPTTTLSSQIDTHDFRPSIFVRTYIDQMFRDAGYTYSSDFFNSNFFNRLIIPYNGDWPTLTTTNTNLRMFKASISGATTNYVRKIDASGVTVNSYSAATTTAALSIPYNDETDTTKGNFDSGGTYNNVLYKWTCPNAGVYDFTVAVSGIFTYSASTTGWRYQDNPPIAYYPFKPVTGTLYLRKNGVTVASKNVTLVNDAPATRADPWVAGTNGPDIISGTQYTYNWSETNWINTLGSSSTPLLPGDVVDVKFNLVGYPFMDYYSDGSKYTTFTGGTPVQSKKVPVTCSFKFSTGVTVANSFKNQAYGATIVSDLETITINDYIPKKVKKKDFFGGLVNLFNLYIEQDPNNETNLLIKTRDEYYSSGKVEDWTYKFQQDKEHSIKFLSELQNKKLIFTYTQDETNINLKDYKANTNFVYGEFDVEFDNDFLTGEKTIKPIFAPTAIVKNGMGNIVSDIDSRAPKNTIRILYCPEGLFSGGSQPTYKYRYLVTGMTGGYVTKTLPGYIWAGHFDNPVFPDLDINYGTNVSVFYNGLSAITTNTLYNTYWLNYVSQISNGKLLTGYFDLTLKDIINTRFFDRIFIKDSYYFLNKIQDFNPLKRQLTKVELIKVDSGLRNTPSKLPIAISTGDFTNTYTSTARASAGGTGGVSSGVVEAGNDVFTNRAGVVVGTENVIQNDVENNIISGDANKVNASKGVVILNGSGNTVAGNNVIIINTNNKIIREDNVTYFNGIKIKDGVVYPTWNVIDSGMDKIYNPFNAYTENNIDSGLNTVKKGGGLSPLSSIESGEDSTNQ
jgi:hypothetical protein